MKVLTLLLIVLFYSNNVIAQSTDEVEIRKELDKVWKSLENGDVDFLRKHYIPEVTRFHMTGNLDIGWDEEKAKSTEDFFASGWKIVTEKYKVSDIRVFGDMAITAGTGNGIQSLGDGTSEEMSWRFTYVWVKQDGRWLEAHHHVSPIE